VLDDRRLRFASAKLRAEWTEPHQLIRRDERLAEEPHVAAMSLTQEADFSGQSPSHFGISAWAE
jgi:hypothetical protein